MTTLDSIIEMQKSNMTDNEIASNLQSQGVSPQEINDSLNQAKIKTAVTANTSQNPITPIPGQPSITDTKTAMNPLAPTTPGPPQAPTMPNPPTTPTGQPTMQVQPEISQYPEPQTSIMQEQPNMDFPIPQETLPPEGAYPQDTYGEEEYYEEDYAGGYTETETITEIAEQVVTAKFKEFQQKTGDIAIFQNTMQDKIANMEERLKRLENTIDKLQHAIIQKIGEFGENTNMIKKDLDSLHNTTSKLMNPLIDNYRELEKITKKRH
jgi:hypothetical protein